MLLSSITACRTPWLYWCMWGLVSPTKKNSVRFLAGRGGCRYSCDLALLRGAVNLFMHWLCVSETRSLGG